MTEQTHPSVHAIWYSYIAENVEDSRKPMPESWHFGLNKQDADTCAMLVKAGLKTASSGALASYLNYQVPVPAEGDLAIITNWEGEAQCIIRTTQVDIVPFNEVTDEHAMMEGEGDQTLQYWNKVHWEFFSKDLSSFGELPTDDMMVICEQFEMIYQL